MANPTTNFGWVMPTSTDLVTDLPADFAIFGQAVDTSMADLKGGTTGQVLSKATNADMDFTWVAQDDSNAIQNAIVDAKGDLITATAADTPARLAVGATNGMTLQVDSSTATGLKWATPAAGTSVYIKLINAGSNYSTTSTTSVAVSTTNARITATPAGTTATVMLEGFSNNSGNTTAEWTISTGGTGTIMGFPVYNNSYQGTAQNNAICIVSITGLTAGTSYNFDWFYKITGTGTTSIIGDTATVYPKMVLIC